MSNVNNPENIYKTTEYTEFKNINDCAQIHISGVSTLADPIIKYKYLSFIYSLGENNTGISSTCELSLNAHNDNFILGSDDLLIDLIPSIVLNSGGRLEYLILLNQFILMNSIVLLILMTIFLKELVVILLLK